MIEWFHKSGRNSLTWYRSEHEGYLNSHERVSGHDICIIVLAGVDDVEVGCNEGPGVFAMQQGEICKGGPCGCIYRRGRRDPAEALQGVGHVPLSSGHLTRYTQHHHLLSLPFKLLLGPLNDLHTDLLVIRSFDHVKQFVHAVAETCRICPSQNVPVQLLLRR